MQENSWECEAQTVAVLGRNTCCEAGRSFWASPQCMCGLVAPQFRKVALKMLEMGKSHRSGHSGFQVAVTEEMLNHPTQNGASLSLNLLAPVQSASVPPLQKSSPPPPASCLITWKSDRLYIPLPSCLIFVIDFPPFGALRGILVGSQARLRWPPQAREILIVFLKKSQAEKFFVWIGTWLLRSRPKEGTKKVKERFKGL